LTDELDSIGTFYSVFNSIGFLTSKLSDQRPIKMDFRQFSLKSLLEIQLFPPPFSLKI